MAEKDEAAAVEQELLNPPENGDAKPAQREAQTEPAPAVSEEEADRRAAELENKHKFVRKEALDEERIARKNAEKELRRQSDMMIRLEERLNSVARPAPQEPAPPDPEEDIFGYAKHLAGKVDQLQGVANQYQQNTQQQQQVQSLIQAYRADAEQFRSRTPDFLDAYNHYRKTRQQELSSMGYSPQQIGQALEADELAIANQAFSVGRSPAEAIYAIAGVRGYQKQAPALLNAEQQGQQQGQANNQIKRLAAAQQAGASLANAGGAPAGNGKITLESLVNMDDKDFRDWWSKNGDDGLRRISGAN
jgi:hypothetical protein